MARWKSHGTTSNTVMTLVFLTTSIYRILGRNVYPLKSILEIVEYRYWLAQTLKINSVFMNKKRMLDFLICELNRSNTQNVNVVEFGVAFGETLKYLINRIEKNFKYHGFDTFTGLPKSWRGLPAGAISANGHLPATNLPNIRFHKGLVEDTLNDSALATIFDADGRVNLIIFDFDLYEPTLFAFRKIEPFLKKNDILYFDEAFDRDERIILENYVLSQERYCPMKASIFGIAFCVTS